MGEGVREKKYPEKGLRNGGKECMGCGGGRGIEGRRRWKRRRQRWLSESSKGRRLPNMSSVLDKQFSTHTSLKSESRLTYYFAFPN